MKVNVISETYRVMYKSEPNKKRLACEIKCTCCDDTKWVLKNRLHMYADFKCNACKKLETTVDIICAYCNKEFTRKRSSLISKSGLYFCCRDHKDLAQRIEFGLDEIHPPHYDNNSANYRDKAYRVYDRRCSECGYDEHPEIIQVHHKDSDRSNNLIENLQVLCPNCHAVKHFVK